MNPTSSHSTDHRCLPDLFGGFFIHWTAHCFYPNRQGRVPRRCRRNTDQKGAERFCKKHQIAMPIKETT